MNPIAKNSNKVDTIIILAVWVTHEIKGGEGGVVELTGTKEEIDVARKRRKDGFLKVLGALNMIYNK